MLIRSVNRVRSSTFGILGIHSRRNFASNMSTSREPLRNVLGDSKSPYLLQHKDNPVAVSILYDLRNRQHLRTVARIHTRDDPASKRARQADLPFVWLFGMSLVRLSLKKTVLSLGVMSSLMNLSRTTRLHRS